MSFADCVSKSVIISACSFCFCTSATDVDVNDEPGSTGVGFGFGFCASSASMGNGTRPRRYCMLKIFPNASLSFLMVSSDGLFCPFMIRDIELGVMPMMDARCRWSRMPLFSCSQSKTCKKISFLSLIFPIFCHNQRKSPKINLKNVKQSTRINNNHQKSFYLCTRNLKASIEIGAIE